MLPNILSLTLGKNRKIISSTTHQLSLSTNPLTVLLTPPNNSPTGSAGSENGTGCATLGGASIDNRLLTGEVTDIGAGSGAGAGVRTG